jgi:hypothetical protein
MVIASLNGTHAQGFVEVIERSDGSVERTGLLKLSVPSAIELRHLLEADAPIIYAGPVLDNGRWRADSFNVTATDVAIECVSDELVNVIIRAGSTNGHAR